MDATLSLVLPQETTDRQPFPPDYQTYKNNLSPAEVMAARCLYAQVDSLDGTEYGFALSNCRSHAWFVRHKETGIVRVHSDKCHLRWCFHCSEARQMFITKQVSPWFHKVENPKLLTLTLRHTSAPLKEQIEFIYKCWQKFRKRKYLSDRIHGGVWFFQIKISEADGLWHPHFHVLLDADFLVHRMLVDKWSDITKGSTHVHIRAVHDPEKTVLHNARYAARPSSLVDMPDEKAIELFYAFKGRRLCGTFGSAKDIVLKQQKPEDADQWVSVGSWTAVVNLHDDDYRAREILHCWCCSLPLPEHITLRQLENEMDGLPIQSPPESTKPENFLFNMYG